MTIVRVIMAVHEPSLELLGRQIQSLVEQRDVEMRLSIVLDGPQERRVCDWLAERASDNIEILSLPRHHGPQLCFVHGLKVVLATSSEDLFSFSDQDDVWSPEKLSRQARILRKRNASLTHSDARVVDSGGKLIHPSLHRMEQRSGDHTLASLIMMNSVTGMTALFTRQTAELATSMGAEESRGILHDHWVALAAAMLGEIVYLDEPLVDYTQHAGNTLGASDRSRHGFNLAALLEPVRYVRRCQDQFLARSHVYRRAARAAATEEGVLLGALVSAGRLFGGHRDCVPLLTFAIRKMIAGEFRMARAGWRCCVGKLATLTQAIRCGGFGHFDEFLAGRSASIMQRQD